MSANASNSMRFSFQELLAGMLATLGTDEFPDDAARLQTVFNKIAGEFPLFAPFAATDDAVAQALSALEAKQALTRGEGRYALTLTGRAHCVSSKRTLFNKGDRDQLEGAAQIFATL